LLGISIATSSDAHNNSAMAGTVPNALAPRTETAGTIIETDILKFPLNFQNLANDRQHSVRTSIAQVWRGQA
jgi:hypothetical protein